MNVLGGFCLTTTGSGGPVCSSAYPSAPADAELLYLTFRFTELE